jgi:hypothetical protein
MEPSKTDYIIRLLDLGIILLYIYILLQHIYIPLIIISIECSIYWLVYPMMRLLLRIHKSRIQLWLYNGHHLLTAHS